MAKAKKTTKKKTAPAKKKPSRNGKPKSEAMKTTKPKAKTTKKSTTAKKKTEPRKKRRITTESFALAQPQAQPGPGPGPGPISVESITITSPAGVNSDPNEVLNATFGASGVISPQNSNGRCQVLTLAGGAASTEIAFTALGQNWSAGPFQTSAGGNLNPGDYFLRARFPNNESVHQIEIVIQ